jgi:hypothetical protein
LGNRSVVHPHWIVDSHVLDVPPHSVGSGPSLECHAHKLEPPIGVLALQLNEARDLVATRPTPRRPEVKHHHFALVLAQSEGVPVNRFQRKIGRGGIRLCRSARLQGIL